jgi:hypothetical protein
MKQRSRTCRSRRIASALLLAAASGAVAQEKNGFDLSFALVPRDRCGS